LACTHYPLLKKTIEKTIDSNIKVINPAEKLATEIKNFLQDNPEIEKTIKKGKNHQFFFSDEPYNLEKISRLCFAKKIKATINDPFKK
jgi:glutamate racemase